MARQSFETATSSVRDATLEPQTAANGAFADALGADHEPFEANATKSAHESHDHSGNETHHHHSHARNSQHGAGHHLLSVEDLSVRFRMYDPDYAGFLGAPKVDLSVLEHLNISVHRHEVLALVGGSGSGKSVLADAILGVYEPNARVEGTIWFDGERCDAKDLARLRRRAIACMPQSLQSLDPMTRIDHALAQAAEHLSTQKRRGRIDSYLAHFELDPSVLMLYPHELSGGMARRVIAIAALLREPELLVADEPTPGLDKHLARKLLAELRAVANRSGGVLLITHDLTLALAFADRVAVFHKGTIVEETSVEAFASPDTLRSSFAKELWHALPEHGFDGSWSTHA